MNGYFFYDGKSSREWDLWVGVGVGENEIEFGVDREVSLEGTPASYEAFGFRTKHEPLKRSIKLWCERPLTRQSRLEICKWLFKGDFCEFYTEDNKEVVYYCMLQGDSKRFVAGDDSGYLDVELICCNPCAWSSPNVLTVDLRRRADGTSNLVDGKYVLNLKNLSNFEGWYKCRFDIYVPSASGTDKSQKDLKFTIWNRTNSLESEKFEISSELGSFPLRYEEKLSIDMVTGETLSNVSISGLVGATEYWHRRNNSNSKFILLDYGSNEIEVTGHCILKVHMQSAVAL